MKLRFGYVFRELQGRVSKRKKEPLKGIITPVIDRNAGRNEIVGRGDGGT